MKSPNPIQTAVHSKIATFLFYSLPITLLVLAGSCRNTGQQSANAGETERSSTEAIKAIIAQDEELGARRNHATEDTSLSATIRQYTASVSALDFRTCPEAFTTAFHEHIDAWEASIAFFAQYDSLRGEMHKLFATIEKEQPEAYQAALKPIMDTWGEVEAEARKYGALPEEEES